MKIYTTLAALQLGLALAASVSAQDAPVEVTVLATMDPWKAGGYDDGSDGLTPAAFTFAAGPKQFITFPRITGIWSCGTGTPAYGPDGTDMTQVCNGPRYINGPIGTFAGYATTDF